MPSPTKSPSVIESVVADAMDFPAAIKAIIEGKKITKLEWNDPYTFGILKDGTLMIHRKRPESRLPSELSVEYDWYQWVITDGDLLGTDWVVIPSPT